MATKPFTRTTIRLHPQTMRDMQKLANKRGETWSEMLRRYVRDGMARDGWTPAPPPASVASVLE